MYVSNFTSTGSRGQRALYFQHLFSIPSDWLEECQYILSRPDSGANHWLLLFFFQSGSSQSGPSALSSRMASICLLHKPDMPKITIIL